MTTTSTTHSVYGQTYGGAAPENYQRYFVPVIGGPFAADLVAEAALHPGERVLDVAVCFTPPRLHPARWRVAGDPSNRPVFRRRNGTSSTISPMESGRFKEVNCGTQGPKRWVRW